MLQSSLLDIRPASGRTETGKEGMKMGILRVVLTVLFIFVCVALVFIVLLQEGKAAGLGAISGLAETYWGKNKGRSREGWLLKGTKILAVAFILLAIVLNLNVL